MPRATRLCPRRAPAGRCEKTPRSAETFQKHLRPLQAIYKSLPDARTAIGPAIFPGPRIAGHLFPPGITRQLPRASRIAFAPLPSNAIPPVKDATAFSGKSPPPRRQPRFVWRSDLPAAHLSAPRKQRLNRLAERGLARIRASTKNRVALPHTCSLYPLRIGTSLSTARTEGSSSRLKSFILIRRNAYSRSTASGLVCLLKDTPWGALRQLRT